MKKTILTSVSVLALLALASCSTDNMPTEATNGNSNRNTFNAMEANTTSNTIAQDSILTPDITSRSADNGDIAILKDKRKINSASYAQENGDIAILKDKRK
ncbi:hypothetical protein [Myroides sp. DW712]|uniref:hypothetical protein n=1 Tax=Myroides sp. DW712 TaxID=3389800 RepID=UPI00397B3ADB